MFYSQFILAKKGPLGTIWIAAHLERKLRKNQVADTDIGVSVDSILFPEVPIALRLSSHLLLGVVRIYSRKVNYLFHDCSEALLKIKQAFRSTAVDLPPEESTAPYHSITLPETFDLDDFELPDNELFQGNFVDHHISTREQITLQDTMDGMVFSTSQFGPDERFGDGDTSQIGLDLDENLFMDKIQSAVHASTLTAPEEDEDRQMLDQPVTTFAEMDIDDHEIPVFTTGDLLTHLVQTPDLNEVFPGDPVEGSSVDQDAIGGTFPAAKSPALDLIESAQAPSTPGLVQEAIPANFQETGDHSHLESEDPGSGKFVSRDFHIGDSSHDVDCPPLNDKSLEVPALPNILPSETSSSSVLAEIKPDSLLLECLSGVSAATDEGTLHQREVRSDTLLSALNNEIQIPSSTIECAVGSLGSLLHVTGSPVSESFQCKDDSNVQAIKHVDSVQALEVPALSNILPSETSSSSVLAEIKPDSLLLECLSEVSAATDEGTLHQREVRSDTLQSALNNEIQIPSSTIECAVASQGCLLHATGSPVSESLQCKDDSNVQAIKHVDSVLAVEDKGLQCKDDSNVQAIKHVDSVQAVEDKGPTSHELKACSSSPCPKNVMPSLLVENISNLADKEAALCTLETVNVDEGNCVVSVADTNLEAESVVKSVPSINDTNFYNLDVSLTFTPRENLNWEANSGLPAPETLVLAPPDIPKLPNDLVLSSAEQEITNEGGRRVDTLSYFSGQKRKFMDSTPFQNISSTKLSRLAQSKRSAAFVPDDDDVLASILVGRTPLLKVKPTPSPLQPSKRSRLMTRTTVTKRKVLVDAMMVMHGDAIRQQLTNTEDIRRVRRKVPCTRTEIWRSEKSLLEDEMFSEPLFIGMSTVLASLPSKEYNVRENLELSRSMGLSGMSTVLASLPSKEFNVRENLELSRSVGLSGMPTVLASLPSKEYNVRENLELSRSMSLSGMPTVLASLPSKEYNVRENLELSSSMGLSGMPTVLASLPSKEYNVRENLELSRSMGLSGMSTVLASLPSKEYNVRENLELSRSMGLSGMSTVLASLPSKEYNVRENLELSRTSGITMEASMELVATPSSVVPGKNSVKAQEPSEMILHTESRLHGIENSSLACNSKEQSEAQNREPQVDLFENGQSNIAALNKDLLTVGIAETAMQLDSQIFDGSCMTTDHKSVVQPSDELGERSNGTPDVTAGNAVGTVEKNYESLVHTEGKGASMVREATTTDNGEVNVSSDMAPLALVHEHCKDATEISNKMGTGAYAMKDISSSLLDCNLDATGPAELLVGTGEMEVIENSIVSEKEAKENGSPSLEHICSEGPYINKDTENASLNEEQTEGLQNVEPGGAMPSLEHTCSEGPYINKDTENVPLNEEQTQEVEPEGAMPALEHTCSEGPDINKDTENVPLNEEQIQEVEPEGAMPALEHTCSEGSDINKDTENVPFNEEQIQGFHEVEPEGAMAAEVPSVPGDSSDFVPMLEENDTEFLNVDDEAEPMEEEDYDISDSEKDHFFENSGWSTRTRAVARYLKSMFDNESGHGRKVVQMDNLLVGKTRKEASRMFFETLVLKTKDYVQVEQENSFDNITIKPRLRLMKSEI